MERAAPRESAREGARRRPMLLRRLIQIREAAVRHAVTSQARIPPRRSGARRSIMGATEDIPLARARPWPLVPIMMVLAGAFVSRGFPAPPPSSSGLSERATVELVLIEAYVTDGRGRPIRDLTADDFSLMVDGHAKPIHSLEFHEVSPEAQAPVTATPPAGGGTSARSAPGSLPRRVVLFFDDSTSATQGLTAARKAAQHFLAGSLLPNDEVALASYDRKLRLLHDFTTDRAALTQAIEDTLGDLKRYTDYDSEQGNYEREMAGLLSMSSPERTGRSHLDLLFTNYAEEFTPRSR